MPSVVVNVSAPGSGRQAVSKTLGRFYGMDRLGLGAKKRVTIVSASSNRRLGRSGPACRQIGPKMGSPLMRARCGGSFRMFLKPSVPWNPLRIPTG